MSIGKAARTALAGELGGRWRTAAATAGWAFPDDWYVPAVDAVCEAISAAGDVWAPAQRLGRARAAGGILLAESLADIDQLAALVHRRYVAPLRRAVSLGWAEAFATPPVTVTDPLTGLVTADYLRVRLGEVYRGAAAEGLSGNDSLALVVVRLDLAGTRGWHRTLPMMLVGDSMRMVFDGGQTLALLGESVAVTLTGRNPMLGRQASLLGSAVEARLQADTQLSLPSPRVWVEALPPDHAAALDLLIELAR